MTITNYIDTCKDKTLVVKKKLIYCGCTIAFIKQFKFKFWFKKKTYEVILYNQKEV